MTFFSLSLKQTVSLCLFLGTFVVYGYSAARVNPGYADSDELITAAYHLGVAHPPGYPLLITLTHLFTLLPLPGTYAFATNLFAGLLQSLTVVGVFWLILEAMGSPSFKPTPSSRSTSEPWSYLLAAVGGALMLAFSAIFWLYGAVFEVFPLNNLLIVMTLWSALRWRFYLIQSTVFDRDTLKWFIFTTVLAGLGLSHVQSFALLYPALLVILVITLQEKKAWTLLRSKWLAIGLACVIGGFLLPASLLLLLNNRAQDYSWQFDASLSGLVHMIARQDYSGFVPDKGRVATAYLPAFKPMKYIETFFPYWQFLNQHFAYIGVGLGLIGWGWLWHLDWRRGLIWSVAYGGMGLLFALHMGLPQGGLANLEYRSLVGIHHRQYLQGYVLWSVFIGLGFWALAQYVQDLLKSKIYILSVLSALIGIAVGWSIWSHHSVGIQKDHRLAWDYAKEVLDAVEPKSTIICLADFSCFSLFYLQAVEQYRPDVVVLSKNPYLSRFILEKNPQYQGYPYIDNPFFMADLVSWNVAKRPTYLTDANSYYIDYLGLEGNPFFLIPKGLLYQVVTTVPEAVDPPAFGFSQALSKTPASTQNYWQAGIRDYLANIHNLQGIIYSYLGYQTQARDSFDKAIDLNPEFLNPKQLKNALSGYNGNAQYQIGQESSSSAQLLESAKQYLLAEKPQEAYRLIQKATFVDPLHRGARLALAELYELGGYFREARQEYEFILRYAPEDEATKRLLQKVRAKELAKPI